VAPRWQGQEYWALERWVCGRLASVPDGGYPDAQSLGFDVHDVQQTSRRKSFDYRVRKESALR